MNLQGHHAVALHRRRPSGLRLAWGLGAFLLAALGIGGINGVGFQGPYSSRVGIRTFPPVSVAVTIQQVINGGGGMNFLLQDPDFPDTWWATCDVGAIFKTTDGGKSWAPATAGLIGRCGCSAMAYNPSNHNIIYALVDGSSTTQTGLYRSTNRGATWSRASADVGGTSNGAIAPTGDRVIGRLIVPVGSYIYVASTGTASSPTRGLYKAIDGASMTFSLVSMSGLYILGLLQDDVISTKLFASIANDGTNSGVYSVDTTTDIATKLTNSPTAHCQEMAICPVHHRLYLAADTSGAYYSDDHGVTWTAATGLSAAHWVSVDFVHGASDTVVLGAKNPIVQGDTSYGTIYKSTNGGTSYTSVITISNVGNTLYGQGSLQWYMDPNFRLAGVNGQGRTVRFDYTNSQKILVAGKSINGSLDQGATWQPWSYHLPGTAHRLLAMDHHNPTVCDSMNDDWNYFASVDGWLTFVNEKPAVGSALFDRTATPDIDENGLHWLATGRSFPVTVSSGTDKLTATAHGLSNDQALQIAAGSYPAPLAADTTYFVVSATANDFKLAATEGGAAIDITTNGSQVQVLVGIIISTADPTLNSWTDQSSDAQAGELPTSPRAVLAGNDTFGRCLVVLVPKAGIYVRSNGVWAKATSGSAFTATPPAAGMLSRPVQPGRAGAIMGAYDANTGLWKSIDYGQNWTNVSATTSTKPINPIAMDLSGNLYLLANNTLYLVAGFNANNVNPVTPVSILTAVDTFGMSQTGILLAATTPVDGAGGTLMRSRNQGTTWANAGGTIYAAFSMNVEAIEYDDVGRAYLGTNGQGLFAMSGV